VRGLLSEKIGHGSANPFDRHKGPITCCYCWTANAPKHNLGLLTNVFDHHPAEPVQVVSNSTLTRRLAFNCNTSLSSIVANAILLRQEQLEFSAMVLLEDALLLKWYPEASNCLSFCNAQQHCEHTRSVARSIACRYLNDFSDVPDAWALYLRASLFNHSCQPNAEWCVSKWIGGPGTDRLRRADPLGDLRCGAF